MTASPQEAAMPAPRERGILFSAPMIRALLSGAKTQTRRLVKLPKGGEFDGTPGHDPIVLWSMSHQPTGENAMTCPYGVSGDRLWVRETTWRNGGYVATDAAPHANAGKRPAIHLPRIDSRITLEITDVRVQRLNAITEDDAKAEGVRPFFEVYEHIGRDQRITSGELAADAPCRASFACLWDEINGDRTLWSANPWVWPLTFRRLP